MANQQQIQPLFTLNDNSEQMGKSIIRFVGDNYNKELVGASLIDAKNDAEAIEAFLREYKDSPETLRSYAKEVERLLLWCIHISKVNISSLRIFKNSYTKKTLVRTKFSEANKRWSSEYQLASIC